MARLRVEVLYARPEAQELVQIELQEGATVRDALEASGILRRHPDIDLQRASVGVFGTVVTLGSAVADGDRVEIYRPLRADPKEARRKRSLRRR